MQRNVLLVCRATLIMGLRLGSMRFLTTYCLEFCFHVFPRLMFVDQVVLYNLQFTKHRYDKQCIMPLQGHVNFSAFFFFFYL